MNTFSTQANRHVLLHDIRSAHNVGSMFRTADAIGISKIYLSGFTPRPLDRFGRVVQEIAKTALGGELSIPWESCRDPKELIRTYREKNFTIIGIEQDDRSIDYKEYTPPENVLLLVGSEVEGLSQELKNECDVLLEIPMRGMKESLNVSVAFGVALFRIFDR